MSPARRDRGGHGADDGRRPLLNGSSGVLVGIVGVVVGVAAIVWGAETFAEHLADAATRLNVSAIAVAMEAVRHIAGGEADQARLGLTIVGFATALELVVLAVSAARRGMTDAVVASVVGSFAYNATMTLGAGALARRCGPGMRSGAWSSSAR